MALEAALGSLECVVVQDLFVNETAKFAHVFLPGTSGAHLCVYGLYAPMNEMLLRELGVGTVLGGEFEPGLLSLAERLRSTRRDGTQSGPLINLGRIKFLTPDRTGLPPLARYAHLQLPDGSSKVVGFAELKRCGCLFITAAVESGGRRDTGIPRQESYRRGFRCEDSGLPLAAPGPPCR